MLDSMAAVMRAVFRLTSTLARRMRKRWLSVNQTPSGNATVSTRASCHWMKNIMMSAPMMLREQISTFSGPWWASSVTSKRSLTTRLSSTPVRFLS